VLVKMRSIEIAKTRLILWEMCRNPIQNHSNSVLMEMVHEIHEVAWRPKPAGRSEVAGRLVSPRTIEGMLHNWKQFNVRET